MKEERAGLGRGASKYDGYSKFWVCRKKVFSNKVRKQSCIVPENINQERVKRI